MFVDDVRQPMSRDSMRNYYGKKKKKHMLKWEIWRVYDASLNDGFGAKIINFIFLSLKQRRLTLSNIEWMLFLSSSSSSVVMRVTEDKFIVITWSKWSFRFILFFLLRTSRSFILEMNEIKLHIYSTITIDECEEDSRNVGCDALFSLASSVFFGAGKLREYVLWRLFSLKWLMPFCRWCTRYVCRQPNKPVILLLSIPGHFGGKSNILLWFIISSQLLHQNNNNNNNFSLSTAVAAEMMSHVLFGFVVKPQILSLRITCLSCKT